MAKTTREFALSELGPNASNIDEHEIFPREQFMSLATLGFTGLTLDSKYGGSDGNYVDMMVVIEEIASVCGSSSTVLITHVSLASQTINRFGNNEQKSRWLPDLCSGKKIAAFSLSEPQNGSDALGLATRIEKKDPNTYLLNGNKIFTTNGEVADVFIVFCTSDKSAGYKGITALIVDRTTPGLSVIPQHGKMGMRGSSTAEIIFENCEVPIENRLSDEDNGYFVALKILDSSRIMIAAQCVGIAQGALNASISYAKQRKTFDTVISNHQSIAFMLADMATELDAARLLTYRAASRHDKGLNYSKEAAMAKLYASEASGKIVNKAVQIHGGTGYFRPSPVERMYRDQRVTEIYEGTSEIQRLVISRSLLK
ncbi:MAG: acyl-CoA dehydrogenase family protein [Dehalococcoidia bacterium]|nr:acyl-CoA dehydrogenase family protein [Dehalococcoidia bacterium]